MFSEPTSGYIMDTARALLSGGSSGTPPAGPTTASPVPQPASRHDDEGTSLVTDLRELDDGELEQFVDLLYPLIRERLTTELRHDRRRGTGATFWT